MQILDVVGADIEPWLADLARLRISVFRDFPYLYDGDLDYEAAYLQTYASSPESLFVLALVDNCVVGAATGIPMADETLEFKRPFIDQGHDPAQIFYFGESVLLSDYRGQGVGVRFFEQREAYARRLGRFRHCCFCAVQRPPTHPRRPRNYQPLDDFWRKRGYRKLPSLTTTYSWKELGEAQASPKPMVFWMRQL